MTAEDPGRGQRNLAIDGLRGVGAVAIMLFHMAPKFAGAPPLEMLAGWFSHYYILLDVFFMVSGFVLARGHAQRFSKHLTFSQLGAFYFSRAIRIYPLHLIALAVMILLEVELVLQAKIGALPPDLVPFDRPQHTTDTILTTALLLQSWGFHDKLTWNVPSWYLSALLFAYLAFPWVMRLMGLASAKARPWTLFGLGAASTAALHLAYAKGLIYGANDLSILRALFQVLLGCGIGLLPHLTIPLRLRSSLQLAVVALIVGLIHSPAYDYWVVAAFALLLLLIRSDVGAVARALSIPPLQFLGKISFSLFMIHYVVLVIMDSVGSIQSPVTDALYSPQLLWLNLLLRIPLIVWLAWLIERYVEEPIGRYLQKWGRPATIAASRERAG